MEKTNYEMERDEQVKQNREVFLSMGIQVLALNLRDACSKGGKKGKANNLESENPESDIDYDPTIDNDKQSDTDDDDHDLIAKVTTEVRWIHRPS